mmetsp:Transcript_25571/g.33448  ORF Transcript_25571/g.33448 Transcript_25571/m.33448 type:complete len:474 (+) Transcript_25571:115-1536(+)
MHQKYFQNAFLIGLIVFVFFNSSLCLQNLVPSHLFASYHLNNGLTRSHSFAKRTVAFNQKGDEQLELQNAQKFILQHRIFIDSLESADPKDIVLEEVDGGITNYCFHAFDTAQPSKGVFMKHAKDYVRGFGEGAKLTRERVRYEYDGIQEFSRYSSEVTPAVYVFNEEKSYLVTEFLDGYHLLTEDLRAMKVDLEVPNRIAKLLGQCHADIHADITERDVVMAFKDMYKNEEHFKLWDDHLFPPLLDTLNHPEMCKNPDLCEDLRSLCDDGLLVEAVEQIRKVYLNKKQSLVHADLHSNNILVTDEGGGSVKVIDFEKFAYGPCGLDLGQFFCNYAWYYACANKKTDKDAMADAVVQFWETYKDTFKENALSKLADDPSRFSFRILEETLTDAVGFMGLYMIFLIVACPVEVLDHGDLLDNECKEAQKRQLRIASRALKLYIRSGKLLPVENWKTGALLEILEGPYIGGELMG